MSKKEKSFFEKIKDDLFMGTKRIIDSLKEGFSLIYEKKILVIKYVLVSILIAFIVGLFIEQYLIYSLGVLLLLFSILILLFHYELFEKPLKNKSRFAKNVLFMFVILVLISFLFSFNADPDPQVNESHPAKIISSSLAFILLVFFFFQSIYLVKAGAGPKIALKSTFNFLGKYGMSAMFYVLLLVFLFALSTIPSVFNPIFIIFSVFLFFGTIYGMFILLYVFWKNTKD